jgi:hypothetical protein
MPSSSDWRRNELAVVTIVERSAVRGVIFRTSRLKIAFRNELADLGMETLNLTLAAGRGIATAGPENARVT